MAYYMNTRKEKTIRAKVVNLNPAMRAFTGCSFVVSNPGQNYTVSKLHHYIMYSVKNTHFFTGNMTVCI